MRLLSITGAIGSLVEFLRYVAAPERLDAVSDEEAGVERDARPRLGDWIVAREELGRDGDGPGEGVSFLGWLIAREPLGGGDEEASDG